MNKLELICQKFILLKNHLDKSDINFLSNHSFRSITNGLKGLYKDESSQNNTNSINKTNEKENNTQKKINKDYLKNLLIGLESSKIKSKSEKNNTKNSNIKNKIKSVTPSNKDVSDNSPAIINDDENDNINKIEDIETKSSNINNNTIPLNENEEEENHENSPNIKKQLNSSTKKENKKKISINIIDKKNKINVKELIINNFSKFGSLLNDFNKYAPKINTIELFYNEQKEKIISMYFVGGDIIYIDTIKKITHLFFNVLSKAFNCLAKETENICNSCLNTIFDIINLIIDFLKNIKQLIKNNNEKIDIYFLSNIKIIGNYCMYVLIIKKYNYEYMIEIQNKKDNNKINEFFNIYSKYLKTVNKMKNIFKDNDMFLKHFMFHPCMVNFIDLFEMNRKIINYQLNVNFK